MMTSITLLDKLAILALPLAIISACSTLSSAEPVTAENKQQVHWSYEGATGAPHWGTLKSEYATCAAGTQQSPIDFSAARSATINAPNVNWSPFKPVIVNNGHTISVNAPTGSSIVLDGKTFQLLQFHFHAASEHTVNGKQYPLEVHFVHQAQDGSLGVLGVFFKQGAENPTLAQIWGAAPSVIGQIAGETMIDPANLLPQDKGFYRYEGSLTTPPCSEVVSWVVYKQPIELSKPQIEAFSSVFVNSFRPTQPLHRRFVLTSR